MLLLKITNRMFHMAHLLATILMTFSDLHSFAYCKSLKCDFSCSCAVFYEILTDIVHHAVPL